MALILVGQLTIDCDNLSCLTFVDATGAYSLSNTTGYGGTNQSISQIISTNFVITDADGNDYAFPASGYLPNSAGDSSICLTASDFSGGLVLVPGATYHLYYEVDFDDDTIVSAEQDFDFPCCGSSITSNLGLNFSIEQQVGCQSIVFADTTGLFDAETNPQGYGEPNPDYSDISSTLISITLSNGNVVEITSFVPTADDFSFTIQASELGYTSGGITDQIMNVSYTVYASGSCSIGYKQSNVLLYCQTQTCINQRIASLLSDDCSCNDTQQSQTEQTLEMLFMLDAIKIVANGNAGCASGKIESLYQQCKASCSEC